MPMFPKGPSSRTRQSLVAVLDRVCAVVLHLNCVQCLSDLQDHLKIPFFHITLLRSIKQIGTLNRLTLLKGSPWDDSCPRSRVRITRARPIINGFSRRPSCIRSAFNPRFILILPSPCSTHQRFITIPRKVLTPPNAIKLFSR
jgi:hypothetical protein